MASEPVNSAADADGPDGNDWKESLSKAELERLKSYERSNRINEIVVDTFDFWTDLALIAVLWVYSEGINPEGSFLSILASSGDPGCQSPVQDRDLFYSLFLASLCVLLISQVARIVIAVHRIALNSKLEEIEAKDKPWLLLGVIVTQFSPHNGQLIIDHRFEESGFQTNVIRYTRVEKNTNLAILALEDFPQFVIQTTFFARVASGDLPVGFYLSTIVTVLNLLIKLGNIGYLTLKERTLRKERVKRLLLSAAGDDI
mmetsp:Transcript_11426/g.13100  ORF Transcript_11426/g.13100 Transcript_11426/m.13100 type:complete len:258 (-) Transcript_11426:435-1208(-)|eukprot:CAMPEP_0184018172 /NCGR_PEP_ID=MMETSP0954-20121128/7990_1 /TAXON_ID=627963 /ORGANISM="Aplanochytrium sp, Strain PBS07" /LENGTH=257 /DNA_ID=CAMNT_0026299581 /DNA_START=120 /DNA_END=893 /DNA_ORIENTATION=+